jgi:CRISPR/Cas system-associated endonuclease Cas1
MAELRKAQVVFSSSPKTLEVSRTFVAAKGANPVANLRQLTRQYRISFTPELAQGGRKYLLMQPKISRTDSYY